MKIHLKDYILKKYESLSNHYIIEETTPLLMVHVGLLKLQYNDFCYN